MKMIQISSTLLNSDSNVYFAPGNIVSQVLY